MTTSHRYTTSSRTPGRVNHGTVTFQTSALKVCPDCDGLCTDEVMPAEHAPHHVSNSRGELSLVNCIGLPIRRSP